jgi:hypothetical protein
MTSSSHDLFDLADALVRSNLILGLDMICIEADLMTYYADDLVKHLADRCKRLRRCD